MSEDRYCGLLTEKDLTKHQKWLGCSALEEHLIMEIAHGLVTHQYPWLTLERDSEFAVRHRELKRAIFLGEFDFPAGTKANGATIITRRAMKAALKKPYLRSANWLGMFLQRWQEAPANEGSADGSFVTQHAEMDAVTRLKITAVLDFASDLRRTNPKMNRAEIIRQIVGSQRFKREYSEVSIHQIVYGSYPWMKEKGISGLPK
jgi:hypothetical protein